MKDRIVLFDLNGTLNTDEGLEYYRKQANRDDTSVGILTANALIAARMFIDDNGLEPDIVSRSFLKSKELLLISLRYDVKQKVYVGNMPTDELASNIAGWEYISVSQL